MSAPTVSIIISAPRPFGGVPPQLATFLALQTPQINDVLLVGQFDSVFELPERTQLIVDNNLARARNRALQQVTGDILCFIDAFDIPSDGWLENLLEPFSDPEVIGAKGVFATSQRKLVPRFLQAEYADRYTRIRDVEQIDLIELFSAAYRRDVLLANDGFDERFPDLNDRELSYRLKARGYKLVFVQDAVVFDNRPISLIQYANRKAETAFWNAQVVRRFPAYGLSDTQTPQVLKLQMILAGLATICLVLPPLWIASVLLFGLFALSTVPFALRTLRRDPAAGLIAPGMLFVRSLALMMGYGWGVIRPKPNITNAQTTIGGYHYLLKRSIDIVGGIVGCTVLLILLPVVALAIKLDSRGPVFFKQTRIGKGGQPFRCYKFRTMRPDAEALLDDLIDIEALEEPAFKLEDDPRVTGIGRILRRWSIDEIPQFWNVLRGDMSLVGPRPEESRIVARYNDWQRRRLAVKPGISGPMQVSGRANLPLNQRVRLEIDYIENYSLRRDLAILLQTLPTVFAGEGAR